MTAKTIAIWVGLIGGLAALLLQFAITIPLRLANGDSFAGAVVFYFSFFTILTNIALVLIYAAELWPRAGLGWFRWPVTRAMMVAAISLVGIFYHFILAETWNPEGLSLVADVAMHYATPVFYVLWWLIFARHGMLRLGQIPAMLVPPIIYFIYAMTRGAIVGEYPYPIMEANRLGYAQVAINVGVVLVGLTVLCAITIGLDRLVARVTEGGRRP